MDNFVNLHLHTMYSIQDSVIKITDLANKINLYQQSACAITDHSSCAGWIEFARVMRDNDIKPIFGNEFYCRDTYDGPKTRDRDHLVMLAMTDIGLANIRRLQRVAVENYYYKPILSYECLKQYDMSDIYGTSACSLGSIAKAILDDDIDTAENYALFFDEVFNNNFSLELQFHPLYEEQAIVNNGIVSISEQYGIPLTVSCDSHFIGEEDKGLRKIVQAISWKKGLDEVNDSMSSNAVGNSDIIRQNAIDSGFDDINLVNKAIKQTYVIANRCNANPDDTSNKIPQFTMHDDFDEIFSKIW